MTESDAARLANRVSACAVGLAFAERADADALRELIDMAGGDQAALVDARGRVAGLEVVDAAVLRRALRLLEAAVLRAADVPDIDVTLQLDDDSGDGTGPLLLSR